MNNRKTGLYEVRYETPFDNKTLYVKVFLEEGNKAVMVGKCFCIDVSTDCKNCGLVHTTYNYMSNLHVQIRFMTLNAVRCRSHIT